MMKEIITGVVIVVFAGACLESSPESTNVTIKASTVSSTGKTSSNGRIAANSVIITDFKINLSNIKFELDEEDSRHSESPVYEDQKLMGPFQLDLLNPDETLNQTIASLDIPSGVYEKVEVRFDNSATGTELAGKTYVIKGTIDGVPFICWSDEDTKIELDFENAQVDVVANGDALITNIKISIDALLARFTELAKAGTLKDTDGDGVIEITTENDDDNRSLGREVKGLLETECHIDDKD